MVNNFSLLILQMYKKAFYLILELLIMIFLIEYSEDYYHSFGIGISVIEH
jgi:hypothetical protein